MNTRRIRDYQQARATDSNYWELLIEQYIKIRSHMSQSEFCKSKGILSKDLKKHLYKSPLYQSPVSSPFSSDNGSFMLAEVSNTESIDSQDNQALSYNIKIGLFSLSIPYNFDKPSLSNLLKVLSDVS